MTIKLPAGEKAKTNKDESTTIAGNTAAFVAIIGQTAAEGGSTLPSSAHAETSFDLDEAMRELPAILEDITLPAMITPLALTPMSEPDPESDFVHQSGGGATPLHH